MAHQGFRLSAATPMADRLLFHAACDVTTRCWNWLGSVDSQTGYARIGCNGRCLNAHRASYEVFTGPIPDGLQIDHLCRNRKCINPGHLEAVTAQVNVRRGESPGARALRRTHCKAGHDFSVHGTISCGRRICRPCRAEYLRAYKVWRKAERDVNEGRATAIEERMAS